MRQLTPIILCAAAPLAVGACQQSAEQEFWRAGAVYTVTLVVKQRSPSLQQHADADRSLQDTVSARLKVDRIASDSIFGSYEADWRALGVWIGPPPPSPQTFAAKARDRDFSLRLSPDAVDAGAELQGRVQSGEATGQWGTDGAKVRGDFRLASGS